MLSRWSPVIDLALEPKEVLSFIISYFESFNFHSNAPLSKAAHTTQVSRGVRDAFEIALKLCPASGGVRESWCEVLLLSQYAQE